MLTQTSVAPTLGNCYANRRFVHIQPDISDIVHSAHPMHEALCRPSGTTLDSVHAERRAADHSANIGLIGRNFVDEQFYLR